MGRGDLCGMCLCDGRVSYNFQWQGDEVSGGGSLTRFSEPGSETRSRRQIRQLRPDKRFGPNKRGEHVRTSDVSSAAAENAYLDFQ